MINPSANGWIEKFFHEQNESKILYINSIELYKTIRKTGLIYGYSVGINSNAFIEIDKLKVDEVFKLSLLSTLYDVFCFSTKNTDSTLFITKLISFYHLISPKGFSLLNKISPPTPNDELESLLNSRIQTNKDSISKSFSHIVTNALLFLDVLAFKKYLIDEEISLNYLKKTEEIVISLALLSLKIKLNKTHHDDLLIKLFEASVKYSKFADLLQNENKISLESLPLSKFNDDFEKFYLIDITAMTLWSDGKIENEELYFLEKVTEILNVDISFCKESSVEIHEFITQYKKEIPYLNYSNPVKHFYDKTTENVTTLLSRNKLRLVKELKESKELVALLHQSTKRDLDKDEKKKVKKQLLDVFKTIPSFAIFMLPGGSLLLPICIRFIPQLLPSAFNENFDD